VNWSTSNAAVFTVSQQGVVTAVGAGTATLTVTSQADGTRFATAIVTVTDPCAPIAYQLGSTVSGTITTANCLNTISTGAAWYGNVFTYSDVTPLLDPGILTDRGG
jgi:uncharacterized protein YjdB